MKRKLLITVACTLLSFNSFCQKTEYQLRDVVFMCYGKLNGNMPIKDYEGWLVNTFGAVSGETENDSYSCYNLPDFPKGLVTRFLLMPGKIGLETSCQTMDEYERASNEYAFGMKQLESMGVLETISNSNGIFILHGSNKKWKVQLLGNLFSGTLTLLFQEYQENRDYEESNNSNNQKACQGIINDPDGYVNIRKSNNGNSEIIDIVKDGEVFTYWETNDNWYVVQTSKGVKGFMHKSRIKPILN